MHKIISTAPFTLILYPKPDTKPDFTGTIPVTEGRTISNIFGITTEGRLKAALDKALESITLQPGITQDDKEKLDTNLAFQAIVWQIYEKGFEATLLNIVMRPTTPLPLPSDTPPSTHSLLPIIPSGNSQDISEAPDDFEKVQNMEPLEAIQRLGITAFSRLSEVSQIHPFGTNKLFVLNQKNELSIVTISHQNQLSISNITLPSTARLGKIDSLFPSDNGILIHHHSGTETEISRLTLTDETATVTALAKLTDTISGISNVIEFKDALVFLAGESIAALSLKTHEVSHLSFGDNPILSIAKDPKGDSLYCGTKNGIIYRLDTPKLTGPIKHFESKKGEIKQLKVTTEDLYFATEHELFRGKDTWQYRHHSTLNNFEVIEQESSKKPLVISGGNDIVVLKERTALWKSPQPASGESHSPVFLIHPVISEDGKLSILVVRKSKESTEAAVELIVSGVSETSWTAGTLQGAHDLLKLARRHEAVQISASLISNAASRALNAGGTAVGAFWNGVTYVLGSKPE